MGTLVELVTPLHKKTSRDYLARMMDDKVHCMEVARQYGKDYWDGDRRYGYGGYTYDGRWKPLAQRIVDRYRLGPSASVLDAGCGKAHLLHELKQLIPDLKVLGFDPSVYGLSHAPDLIHKHLFEGFADEERTWNLFNEKQFDLVLSINVLHNLKRNVLQIALSGIQRVGKEAYICVESYRNAQEQFNLQCWALTCWAFYTNDEWVSAFREYGYTGDYEFIYFE